MNKKKEKLVHIDLTHNELFTLMLEAHQKDITLNQLCNDIFEEEMKKYEKRTTRKTMLRH